MNNKFQERSEFLRVSGFSSIKTRIILFALLATIIPSLVLGGLFYWKNRKLLEAKLSQQLSNATVQASSKLDLWLKERLYDLRVFASSYILSENFVRLLDQGRSAEALSAGGGPIGDYLRSVSAKFDVYDVLTIMSLDGVPVATSAPELSTDVIPDSWRSQLKSAGASAGSGGHIQAFIDHTSLYMAETVRTSDGNPLGLLAARIRLETIGTLLNEEAAGGIDAIFLVDAGDRLLVSSHTGNQGTAHRRAIMGIHGAAREHALEMREFVCADGRTVIGMAIPIAFMDWVMVAETEKANAYAEILTLRHLTAMLVGGLMVVIGLGAYLFGHSLVRPLTRLSREAAGVASGNLDVDIPVVDRSEVGYLTQVFNHMVANLRTNREELFAANNELKRINGDLHQLSITDGLTGLFNRKHIMDQFQRELSRAERAGRPLSLLMLDIDHFKKVNDTYGHQIGDTVLDRLAALLRESVRDCDFVGRYGGEEFLILLPESDKGDGMRTAQRIQCKTRQLAVTAAGERLAITVSIGVSGYPEDGRDAEEILNLADDALYASKAQGRDRITAAVGAGGRAHDGHGMAIRLKLTG